MKTSYKNRFRVATWLAPAMGIAAAASVEAATVQITKNMILPADFAARGGAYGNREYSFDLTGDTAVDITATLSWILDTNILAHPYMQAIEKSASFKDLSTGETFAFSYWNSGYGGNIVFGSAGLSGMDFMDARINGGALTGGLLETDYGGRVNFLDVWVPEVILTRLVFNDDSTTAPSGPLAASYPEFVPASAVPEPSSLGLLALGAACLLTRRRLTRKA